MFDFLIDFLCYLFIMSIQVGGIVFVCTSFFFVIKYIYFECDWKAVRKKIDDEWNAIKKERAERSANDY